MSVSLRGLVPAPVLVEEKPMHGRSHAHFDTCVCLCTWTCTSTDTRTPTTKAAGHQDSWGGYICTRTRESPACQVAGLPLVMRLPPHAPIFESSSLFLNTTGIIFYDIPTISSDSLNSCEKFDMGVIGLGRFFKSPELRHLHLTISAHTASSPGLSLWKAPPELHPSKLN